MNPETIGGPNDDATRSPFQRRIPMMTPEVRTMQSYHDSDPDRAERRWAKAIRAHSATVVRPDKAVFLGFGDSEGEDGLVLVASVKTFNETLTTSVASL